MQALSDFNEADYDPAAIRQHALQFDSAVFRQKIADYVDDAWQQFQKTKESNPHA